MNEKTSETYQDNTNYKDNDEMLLEHDFTGGVRGKHYRAYRQGYTVTIHHADGTTTVQHSRVQTISRTLAIGEETCEQLTTRAEGLNATRNRRTYPAA